jgi:hypothetical protein
MLVPIAASYDGRHGRARPVPSTIMSGTRRRGTTSSSDSVLSKGYACVGCGRDPRAHGAKRIARQRRRRRPPLVRHHVRSRSQSPVIPPRSTVPTRTPAQSVMPRPPLSSARSGRPRKRRAPCPSSRQSSGSTDTDTRGVPERAET